MGTPAPYIAISNVDNAADGKLFFPAYSIRVRTCDIALWETPITEMCMALKDVPADEL